MPATTRSARARAAAGLPSSALRRDEAAARVVLLLDALPADLLPLVLTPLSIHDLGRVDQLCHAIHSAPEGERSVLEEALRRRRAAAGGFELPLEPTDLGGEASMSQLLMWLERRQTRPKAQFVACGCDFSVFVDLRGGVLTSGFRGVAGHGDLGGVIVVTPVAVPALQGVRVVSVSAGPHHAFAITEAGALYSWGWGSDFRLGHGGCEDQSAPKIIESLQGVRVVQAAAGRAHSVAVADDGRLFEWGFNGAFQRRAPELCSALNAVKVVDVSAGFGLTLALSDAGKVYSWGTRYVDYYVHFYPTLILALAEVTTVGVSCHANHCLAVTDEGRVYSWGSGLDGRLGHGDFEARNVPTPIEDLQFEKIVSVTASSVASFAVTASGKVYSWGSGYYGRLGHGDHLTLLSPKRIETFPPPGQTVVRVAAGLSRTVAVTASGEAYGWGETWDGPHLTPHLVQNVRL